VFRIGSLHARLVIHLGRVSIKHRVRGLNLDFLWLPIFVKAHDWPAGTVGYHCWTGKMRTSIFKAHARRLADFVAAYLFAILHLDLFIQFIEIHYSRIGSIVWIARLRRRIPLDLDLVEFSGPR
jgi:hypothetical protein